MPEYNCPHCNFNTHIKTHWNRHNVSQKHLTLIKAVEVQKNEKTTCETEKDRVISLLKEENDDLKHQVDILTANLEMIIELTTTAMKK